MFKSLIFFIRYFLFWLLYFAVDRFIFLLIFKQKLSDIGFSEKIATFYHALRLDASMAAYINAIPLLFFTFQFLITKQEINFKWLKIYNRVLLVLFSLIAVINFNIYREWGSKINARALGFAISTPNEALASSASSPILLTVFIFIILLLTGWYLENYWVKRKVFITKVTLPIKLLASVLLLGINFLLIRGGWGTAPNSQSMAYFSENQVLNHASLNTEWNLVSSILASKKVDSNPYIYMDKEKAATQTKALYQTSSDTTIKVLKTDKPNIVLFILESFTANLTYTLGQEKNITPNFDSLAHKGLLFSQIYATGNRTDKGVIGTLAGYPTLGSGSIVKWPEKMQKIPAISQSLHQNGYVNSFFYGGESEFDNYKAFILSHDYQLLVDKNSFDKKDMNSKWGAYDAIVFNRQIQEAKNFKQPFFSTILSLTNHEPFEVPGEHKFGSQDNVAKFKSTAYYTDSCIASYLNEAKKQPWYRNTLFIFIADHGHILPKNKYDIFDPQRYHIPMLFYGEVIKDEFKGKQINYTGSQQDLAATLLAQLNLKRDQFKWSKNLLNPNIKHFAYFSWDNGFGFIENDHCVTFDNVGKSILYNNHPNDRNSTNQILTKGKAYLQSAYQNFIKL
ncbi:LTA synthase family protein [Pedobacter sp.]|uniref:LTA synthase family protein n=1 Tax=Pedobacter sp. TaxID=1411316 RepID=UPI00396C40DF